MNIETKSNPTPAAIKAAKAIGDAIVRGDDADATFAAIIDRETHAPQLMDALNAAMFALITIRNNHTPESASVAIDRINEILQSHELTHSSSSTECHTPAPAEEAEPLHRQMAADTLR